MSEAPMLFDHLPEIERGVAWRRYPGPCRSSYQMTVDGFPNGLWIGAVSHPTALRPYYVKLPSGEVLQRKFSRLDDAKAAALAALAN
jgi:hypothetical protein